jgi:hypothetical protein
MSEPFLAAEPTWGVSWACESGCESSCCATRIEVSRRYLRIKSAAYKNSRTTGGDKKSDDRRDSAAHFRTTLAWDEVLKSSYASCQSSCFIVSLSQSGRVETLAF